MGWLAGWRKRVKITIDAGDIDANLTDFPILIYISTSSGYNHEDVSFIFDELTADANRKKIAVTTSDGTTQCYVEIEKWDDANEKAWLWAKIAAVDATTNTDLYLYYDSTHADNTTYVGDPNSTPAENVWDANFLFVSHMQDDPDSTHIRDSTDSSFDGTKSSAGHPTQSTGLIGLEQTYDANQEMILLGNNMGFERTDSWTIESYASHPTTDRWDYIYTKGKIASPYTGIYLEKWNSALSHKLRVEIIGSHWTTNTIICHSTTTALNDGVRHHIAFSYNGTSLGSGVKLYVDGTAETVVVDTDLLASSILNTAQAGIGGRESDTNPFNWLGTQDEVRVSNTVRAPAWIKATSETLHDELLDWGSEENSPKFSESIVPIMVAVDML